MVNEVWLSTFCHWTHACGVNVKSMCTVTSEQLKYVHWLFLLKRKGRAKYIGKGISMEGSHDGNKYPTWKRICFQSVFDRIILISSEVTLVDSRDKWPPLGPIFFHFHTKMLPNNRSVHHPLRNPGSYTELSQLQLPLSLSVR